MNIIEALKAETMALRKARSPLGPTMQFHIAEIDKIGKAKNRQTSEDEAIKVIQKHIATIEENLKLDLDEGRQVVLNYEKNVLESVLPQMATDDEIVDFLRELFTGKRGDNIPKKGEVMKALRDEFGALVDMKRAGQISYEIYGV